MADTVTSNVVFQGVRRYAINLTGISDGTGETNVVKVDISTLTLADGQTVCGRCFLEEAEWDVQGFTYIKITWDRTSDQTALICSGRGNVSWKHLGYLQDKGTGDTGDVLLSSVGATNGATYDITLVLQLRP